jgi:hypothetical protein
MCCKIATCPPGLAHGAPGNGCTFLRGDGPGEYRCGLIEDRIIEPAVLSVGAGCCSSLFNLDRQRVLAQRGIRERVALPFRAAERDVGAADDQR